MTEMDVRLERLDTMRCISTHASSATPEENAGKRIIAWAKARGLHEKRVRPRLFGRNTYPTDNPEPHGYECYLTVSLEMEPESDMEIAEIEGELYAVL